jgi:hypothetical protein
MYVHSRDVGYVSHNLTFILPSIEPLPRWKLGQLAPGNTVQFRRITRKRALEQLSLQEEWLNVVQVSVGVLLSGKSPNADRFPLLDSSQEDTPLSPILHISEAPQNKPELRIVIRQVCSKAHSF